MKKKETNILIEIIKPVAGKFNSSANIGDKIRIDKKQATEMIDLGYAKKA